MPQSLQLEGEKLSALERELRQLLMQQGQPQLDASERTLRDILTRLVSLDEKRIVISSYPACNSEM
jgi:hypothetical protein